MGIVDEDGIVLPGGGDHFHAAPHGRNCGKHRCALFQRNTQRQCRAQNIQRIIDHKSAGDIHPHTHPFLRRDGGKGNVIAGKPDLLCPQIRISILGIGIDCAGSIPHQPGSPDIIGVHDAGFAAAEKDRLCVTIGFHGHMIVQMILGKIGENTHIVGHTVDSALMEGMGGNLHHHMSAARLIHTAEQLLGLKGAGGSALRRQHFIADHILIGADQTNLCPPGLLQNSLEQIGRGGFAVGAGDRHHGHLLRGMTVEIGAQRRKAAAGIRHQHIGDLHLGHTLADHHGSPFFHNRGDKLMSIHRIAADGDKYIAFLHHAGIIPHMGDLHPQLRRGGKDLNALQQFL